MSEPLVPIPGGWAVSKSDPTAQAGEYARDHLALAQAASRQAFRGGLEARYSGDPVAYAKLVEAWRPVVEFENDMRTPPVDEEDSVVRNLSADRDGV